MQLHCRTCKASCFKYTLQYIVECLESELHGIAYKDPGYISAIPVETNLDDLSSGLAVAC